MWKNWRVLAAGKTAEPVWIFADERKAEKEGVWKISYLELIIYREVEEQKNE